MKSLAEWTERHDDAVEELAKLENEAAKLYAKLDREATERAARLRHTRRAPNAGQPPTPTN